MIPNDDDLSVPVTSASIATAAQSNNNTVTEDTMRQVSGTENGSDEKHGNLTFKSSADDIMSMDIIFDNVPIEEDPTIGDNVRIIHETVMPSTIPMEHIHYQIIDLNGQNETDSDVPQNQIDESSNDGILVIDENAETPIEYEQIVVDSYDVVIDSIPQHVPEANEATENQSNVKQLMLPQSTPTYISFIETDIVQSIPMELPQENQSLVQAPKTVDIVARRDTRKSNDSNESKAVKRKRKPLPALIGRNKKSKTENPQSQSHPVDVVVPSPSETVLPIIHAENSIEIKPNEPTTSTYQSEDHVVQSVIDAPPAEQEIANDENEANEDNSMDSLVVVESQDPKDSTKTIYEVYVVCPETKKMSDQPLDLPEDVIQRIRLSMMPGAE